jgi:hypothetical protein
MKILRWVLALVVAGYGVMNLFPIAFTTAYKLKLGPTPADSVRLEPLMEATSWLQIAIWVLTVVLLLVAAWRLVRNEKAFLPYVAGVLLSFGNWAYMKMGPVYDSVWTREELQFDYVLLAVELIVAALIWWIERRKGSAAVTA